MQILKTSSSISGMQRGKKKKNGQSFGEETLRYTTWLVFTAKQQYLVKEAVADQWNEGVKIRSCKEPSKGETKQNQSITSDNILRINAV